MPDNINTHYWLCLTCDGVEEVSTTVAMITHRHEGSYIMLSPISEVQYRQYKVKTTTKTSKKSPKGRRVYIEVGRDDDTDNP